jgi:phosphate transport system permease protein
MPGREAMNSVEPMKTEVAVPARVARYTRPKRTRRSVVLADRIADFVISTGGVLVIAAVFGIMAFLVQVVLPLFREGQLLHSAEYELPPSPAPAMSLTLAIDEYGSLAVEFLDDGRAVTFHPRTGHVLSDETLGLDGRRITSMARSIKGNELALGLDDGSLRFARLHFDAALLPSDQAPRDPRRLDDRDSTDGVAIFSRAPGGQTRRVRSRVELGAGLVVAADGTAITEVDFRVGGTVERPVQALVTLDALGRLALTRTESRLNLLTREVTTSTRQAALPTPPDLGEVAGILMTQLADEVLVAERNGRIHRIDVRDPARPAIAETRRVAEAGVRITSLAFLVGEQSLVVGRSDGSVSVFFRTEARHAGTADGRALVEAHVLEPHAGGEVTTISPSQRSKLFVTSDAGGATWVRHSTTERVMLRLSGRAGQPVRVNGLSARDDHVLAVGDDDRVALWQISVPHPETTLRSILGPVWYEGYPEPTYTWQSSSGTDVFEPKLSLVPLIFGTWKATLYSLLFAIPIALLAAIYTSEFVHPSVRHTVKPAMEMMASLPSVVLGFIAALVLAPFVEIWIATVLLVGLTVPLSLIAAAHLWQLLPERWALRFDGLPKFGLMFAAIAAGVGLALRCGVVVEDLLFGGSFRVWLEGEGSATPLLFLLLLPLMVGGVEWGSARALEERWKQRTRGVPRRRAAGLQLLRRVLAALLAVALSFALAQGLAALGLDPRGGFAGSYVQRNTLVVAFAMGFAVIPIIYTIAEDAMTAVPAHLRAASLACGATPWQTAIRIVVPTATSGIFAAVMIGMGRAVGETMIVVMAAGNTPILDWNVFNGLRALTANIAVELPEAVEGGSLYRMLFLAALTLFGMTFAVNTVAEMVRLRFRRRAAEL